MRSIIYNYSRRFFLTSELTKRLEHKIFLLYPSTKYSVMNRTAEYLIRIYLAAFLILIGLLWFAEISLYYAVLCIIIVYAVVNGKIYGDLERLEIRLLSQLETFISDVKFRFQFDGMLEEAIQDAINHAEYEMSLQGEKLLESLKGYYQKETEDYLEVAPNPFFITFYSICLMVLQYGDKKIEGQSMLVRNLGYLKEDIHIELLRRRKINNEFMGLLGLTLIPIFAIKPIEQWALSNMPEMEEAYYGIEGMAATVFLMLFTVAIYKIITMLKRMNQVENYKNEKIKELAEKEQINRMICWYIGKRKKRAEKLNKILREIGYPYNLAEFILIQYFMGSICLLIGCTLGLGFGIQGIGVVFLGFVSWIWGYYGKLVSIFIKKQILIMEREEEIVRFQTIILMVAHIDRITIEEILRKMEYFAVIFKSTIFDISNQLSYKGIYIFQEEKEKCSFQPFEKLLDGFIACDRMPVWQAFADVESDRSYYVEKHKQDNEEIILKKSLIAKTIAFLPLCAVIILKLIVPFVVEGISGLSSNIQI